MATDNGRPGRLFSDYVQSMVMLGLSGPEIESGQGTDGVRVVSSASVGPMYANIRRCRETAGHQESVVKQNGCRRCSEMFSTMAEEVEVERPAGFDDMVSGSGTDEGGTDPLPSVDWGNR